MWLHCSTLFTVVFSYRNPKRAEYICVAENNETCCCPRPNEQIKHAGGLLCPIQGQTIRLMWLHVLPDGYKIGNKSKYILFAKTPPFQSFTFTQRFCLRAHHALYRLIRSASTVRCSERLAMSYACGTQKCRSKQKHTRVVTGAVSASSTWPRLRFLTCSLFTHSAAAA